MENHPLREMVQQKERQPRGIHFDELRSVAGVFALHVENTIGKAQAVPHGQRFQSRQLQQLVFSTSPRFKVSTASCLSSFCCLEGRIEGQTAHVSLAARLGLVQLNENKVQ